VNIASHYFDLLIKLIITDTLQTLTAKMAAWVSERRLYPPA
jgi:hypothetical protein